MGRRLRSLYLWHRWIGGIAALFVLLLTISGLLLNHTDELGLADRTVQWDPLLDRYAVQAPRHAHSYRAGRLQVTQLGERLFLGQVMMPGRFAHLIGVRPVSQGYVVALRDGLLLLSPSGELVERLDESAGLPLPVERLGSTPSGQLAVQAQAVVYVADAELLEWRSQGPGRVDWSRETPLSERQLQGFRTSYRHQMISQERLLLDLHSGRLWGPWGVWLMDGAALLLLLLAVTGLTLWGRGAIKRRRHQRRPG